MKLQIVKNDDESIDGFVSLKVGEDFKSTVSKIIDNSCTEILLLDILDSMDYDTSYEFLSHIIQKVRLNGSLLLRGVSSIVLASSMLNGQIETKQASNVIANINSIHDQRDIITMLEANDFVVDIVRLSGVTYELKATRRINVS